MTAKHSLDGVEVAGVPADLALYPFGVFTTFVCVERTVLGWHEHLVRLARDARLLWGHELDERRVGELVRAHLMRLRAPATLRVSLYPQEFAIGSPASARGCRILVSSGPAVFPFVAQQDFTVCTVDHQRELAAVKSNALFTQIRLRREAQLAGYDDVLFRRGESMLEGATWTILSWRGGNVVTPRDGVLPSITAGYLGLVAEEMGWGVKRRNLSRAELHRADLVMAVNVNHPARAIRSIDGEPLQVRSDLLTAAANAYSELPRDLIP